MAVWAFAASITFGAALLRGLIGFGSALIIVPALTLLYGPIEAVAVSVLMETVASAYLFPQARRTADWRLAVLLAATTLPGLVLGTFALTAVRPALLKAFIGLTSIVFALVMLGGASFQAHRAAWIWPIAGAVSGFFQGSTSMGGPPLVVLLAGQLPEKRALRSTMIALFTLLFLMTIATFAVRGLLDAASVSLALSLVPFLLGALWLGTRLFHRVPDQLFRNVTLIAVVLASVPAVVASLIDLW